MTKVELFEEIRRDYFLRKKSKRQISSERGIHRRMVRDAINNAVPPSRKKRRGAAPVLTPEVCQQIDDWLCSDLKVHRKQRHTARQVWRRLRLESDFTGAESTVRRYVCRHRKELGQSKQAFVPLTHKPGDEAEVDWYEADVNFPWGTQRVYLFQMRACASGREFHMAFPRCTQQAFIEAHVAAFSYFGGVFSTIRYDNLKSAVQKVLKGRHRKESARFVALRSHYLYTAEFCLSGIAGAHEKGGVENGVGRFRRHHLVPVPTMEDFDELNSYLLSCCAKDDMRKIEGRTSTIMKDWLLELAKLRQLPATTFETYETRTCRVTAKGCAQVATNSYSVPIGLAACLVEARCSAMRIDFYHSGKLVASHVRSSGRHQIQLVLDHYLPLLWNKPGALKRSLPLAQARTNGEWPECYDRLWSKLNERFNDSEGARQMLLILMLHREVPADEVSVAVELALERGAHDAGAVSVLVRQLSRDEPIVEPLTGLGDLHAYDRTLNHMHVYDQLLCTKNSQEVH